MLDPQDVLTANIAAQFDEPMLRRLALAQSQPGDTGLQQVHVQWLRDVLRIDDVDPYRHLYYWPTRSFDARELLAVERLGERDYLADEDKQGLIRTLKSTLQTGLSVLGYIGDVLDKPYAATRGLFGSVGAALRGDFQNAAKGFNQVFLLLPFSESYLKDFYKWLGFPVPDTHLAGREALEMWGAPKNEPGFHPLQRPADALLDAAGLAIDLFGVAYLPRFGALTAKGLQLYRLGSGTKAIAKMEQTIANLAPKARLMSPQALAGLAQKPLPELLEALARQLHLGEQELKHVRLLSESLPAGATELERTLQTAIKAGDTERLSALLADLPNQLRFYQALGGARRTVPAVSLEGRAQELATGVRAPLVLETPWPVNTLFNTLGIPTRIEIGTGQATAKAVEAVGNLPGIRHVRALFDWTRKDVADRAAGPAMSLAVDQLHRVAAASKDMLVNWRAWQASMANLAAKYAQLAQLGNNDVGIRTFGDILRYIAEHSRKISGTLDAKALALTQEIFGHQQFTQGLLDFVKEATSTIETAVVPTLEAFSQKLRELGAPTGVWKGIWTEWFPRYTPTTPAESGWSSIGIKVFTAKQAGKGLARLPALDVPGGTVFLNAVSKDPLLVRPIKNSVLQGQVVATDQSGRLWIAGQYARHSGTDTIGRLVDLDALQWRGKFQPLHGDAIWLPLDDLRPMAPPADLDAYIPFGGLTKRQQLDAAIAWLQHHGLPLPQAKKFSARFQSTMQAYLVHRYAEPFLKNAPQDLQQLFYTKQPFNTIKDATQFVKQVYTQAGVPLPSRQAKALGRILMTKNGTSSLVLEHLRTLKSDRGLFAIDILDDVTRRLSYNADALMAMTGLHEMLRRGAFLDETASKGLSLDEVWDRLRWPRTNKPLVPTGLTTLIQHLPPDIVQQAKALAAQTGTSLYRFLRVPESVATHAQRLLKVLLPQTEEALWIEKVARKYLGWMASWLTVTRPAFHVRNGIANALSGAIADAPYDTVAFLKIYYNTLKKALAEQWNDLPFLDEMKQLSVFGGEQKLADITLETVSAQSPLATLLRPTGVPAGLPTIRHTLTNWQGYTEALQGKRMSPLLQAGRQTFGLVEGVGRASVYIAAREAGATPAQAKALVDRVLYDYSRLSGFEKRYVQPTVMFYSWLRQNLGYLIPRVTLDMGSGPAKLLRGLTTIQDRVGRGEMPQWLQSALGFPLWDAENGQTVVVRSLGLPLEDLALLDFNLAKMLSRTFARTNPVFKGAYMMVTGEDPFTDLPLREAQPTAERIATSLGIPTQGWYRARPILNLVDQYQPFSAVIGYYARLLQPRQAPTPVHEALARLIDFSSGVKISTYDLESQQLNELTEMLQERLRSMPGVRTYFRPYIATPYPTPAVEKHMELYKLLEKRWRKEAEERKKLKRQQEQPWQLGGF